MDNRWTIPAVTLMFWAAFRLSIVLLVVAPVFPGRGFLRAQEAVPAEDEEAVPAESDASPATGYAGALSLLLEGDYEEAAQAFRELLEKEPGRDDARRGWAEALIGVGKHAQARHVLESAENLAASPMLLCALGRLYVRIGSLKAAEKRFQEALAVDARHIMAINRLGNVLYRRGRVGEAERTWSRIIDKKFIGNFYICPAYIKMSK